MKKNVKLMIMVTVVIAVVIITFSFWHLYYKRGEGGRTYHAYTVKINVSGYGNFTAYLPVPLMWNKSIPHVKDVSEVMESASIVEGSGKFEIIDTTYGRAILLHSSNSAILRANSLVANTVSFNPLSMSAENYTRKDVHREYWVYSELDENIVNLSVEISLFVSGKYASEEIVINGVLIGGWQKLSGSYMWIVVD